MKRIAVFAVFVLLFSVLIAAAQGSPKPTPATGVKEAGLFYRQLENGRRA